MANSVFRARLGPMKRLDAEAKLALTRAVEVVEAASCAEVVVVVRPESMAPLQAYALAPPTFALLGLALLLEAPWLFSNLALWLDTLLCAWAGFWLCKRFPGFGRVFMLSAARERALTQAAHHALYERQVIETRERTGVLVYVSQRERAAKVVFDRGIRARVPEDQLARAAARIEAAAASTSGGTTLARAIEELGPLLGAHLPRREDDLNELDDGVWEP